MACEAVLQQQLQVSQSSTTTRKAALKTMDVPNKAMNLEKMLVVGPNIHLSAAFRWLIAWQPRTIVRV
jgi:hypothetical protein